MVSLRSMRPRVSVSRNVSIRSSNRALETGLVPVRVSFAVCLREEQNARAMYSESLVY